MDWLGECSECAWSVGHVFVDLPIVSSSKRFGRHAIIAGELGGAVRGKVIATVCHFNQPIWRRLACVFDLLNKLGAHAAGGVRVNVRDGLSLVSNSSGAPNAKIE